MDGQKSAEVFNLNDERQNRTMRGGKGPPAYGGGLDWLKDMSQGTRFLAKRKGTSGSEVDEYIVAAKLEAVEDMFLMRNAQPITEFRWHDTKVFSKENELRSIIEVINGDNKQVQPGPVAGNEEPEVRPGVDED